MITVHRLTQPNAPLLINPDQIQTVESTPDTVVALVSGAKIVVMESPAEVTERVREWRASIANAVADGSSGSGTRARLAAVVAGPGLIGRPAAEAPEG
jgi:flagellar protein FlbD